MAKKEYATLTERIPTTIKNGKWQFDERIRKVRVMSRAEGYAMVRIPGAMPFVTDERSLSPIAGEKEGK